jgi:hypothetical protein
MNYRSKSDTALKFIAEDCKQAALCGILLDNPKTIEYIQTREGCLNELIRRDAIRTWRDMRDDTLKADYVLRQKRSAIIWLALSRKERRG